MRTSITAAVRLFLGSLALFLVTLVAHLPGALAASEPFSIVGERAGAVEQVGAVGPEVDSSFSGAEIPPAADLSTCTPDDACKTDARGSDDFRGEGSPNDASGDLLEDEVDRDELLLVDAIKAPVFTVGRRLSSRTGPSPVCGAARFLDKPPRL